MKTQSKWWLVFGLLAAAALVPAIPAVAGGGAEPVVLRVASPFKPGHILADAGERFKQLLEEDSGGRLSVLLIAGAASEEDVNLQCSEGVVDIQLTGGEALEVFAPQYFFFNAPYVIKDYEHFLRVWNGPIGQKARDQVLAGGHMLSLGTVFRGLRQTTSNKPLAGPADLSGLKLRLPGVPDWIAVWKSLGTEPIAVPLPELYQALKSGRAEASEGDLTQISSFKLAEVQSHLTITNHLVGVGWVMMNSGSRERLSSADRKRVSKAMTQACAWATEKMAAGESKLIEQLKSQGMTLGAADAEAIRAKAKPAVEELFKTSWPVTTWAQVLAQ